jgi:DNA-binding PadR family transcriptional regulator
MIYIEYRCIECVMYIMNSSTASKPDKMLPLIPAMFHILLTLADHERHGYGIMLEVERNTDGELKMGPGTLYGTIKRMREANLIEESDTRPDPALDDERRRYYRLTPYGRSVLRAETVRLQRLVKVAQAKQAPNADLNQAVGKAHG